GERGRGGGADGGGGRPGLRPPGGARAGPRARLPQARGADSRGPAVPQPLAAVFLTTARAWPRGRDPGVARSRPGGLAAVDPRPAALRIELGAQRWPPRDPPDDPRPPSACQLRGRSAASTGGWDPIPRTGDWDV